MPRVTNYTRGIVRRRPVARITDLSQISTAGAGARGLSQLANIAGEITTRIKQSNDMTATNQAVIDRQKEDIEFQEQSRRENFDNPVGFADRNFTSYGERDKVKMESLPSDESRKAYKATADRINLRNFESDLGWENKRATEMFAQRAEDSIDDLQTIAFRGAQPLEEINKNRQATSLSLSNVLSPEQQDIFDRDAEQKITSSFIEGAIDRNPHQAKELLDSQQFDDALGAEKLNTLSNRADIKIKALEAERVKRQSQLLNMRIKDPAQLAVLNGADPNNADSMLEVQEQLEISKGNLSLIPVDDAKRIVNDLNGFETVDNMLKAIGELKEKYPDDDHLSIAMNDLQESGLSDQISFMSMMHPKDDFPIIKASFAMAKDKATIKAKATQRPGITIAEIEDVTSEKIFDTIQALAFETLGGEATTAGLQQNMVDVATFFVAEGKDIKTSVNMATEWFINKVPLGRLNGHKFRVPERYDPSQVEDSIEFVLDQMTLSDSFFENIYLKRIVRPVLTPDNKGYELFNSVNEAVIDENKENIVIPIAEAIDAWVKLRTEAVERRKTREKFRKRRKTGQEE